MKAFISKHHRLLFFSAWFIINFWQAATTGLLDDEAYYWVYSQYPSWGYYDHPPMISWLIQAGNALFPGEAGLRFFIVVLNTLTLVILQQLTAKENSVSFYAVCGSMAVAQIGGILAVPDLPLLFFAALFFYCYKRFIEKPSALSNFLLSLSIALLLYSKYHGILLVIFTIISYPKLLTQFRTYIVAILALILFSPHLFWQYTHDFPSFQYHLFERNAPAYQFAFTTEYLTGQLAFAGPLMEWLIIYAAFKQKPANLAEKAIKFSMAGIYLFFLLSSIRGRVEANWTVPAFTGLIILSTAYFGNHRKQRKWLIYSLPVTLILVFIVRIFMSLDLPRNPDVPKDEMHGNKDWTSEVTQVSNGLPVVFLDSYQKPSKYYFYEQKPSFGLNTAYYRRNNFNFWPLEDSLIGKKAFVIGRKSALFEDAFQHIHLTTKYGAAVIENFYSFSKVQLRHPQAEKISEHVYELKFRVHASDFQHEYFNKHPYDTTGIYIAVIKENFDPVIFPTALKLKDLKGKNEVITEIELPVTPGKHNLRLCIGSAIPGYPSLNSTIFKIEN